MFIAFTILYSSRDPPLCKNLVLELVDVGLIHTRDNLRNLEAFLLSKVCKDVAIEPSLLPVTEEEFELDDEDDDSRLNAKAKGGYQQGQTGFLDIISTRSQTKFPPLERSFARDENEKRAYNRRVLEIEHSAVTPLVFT